MHGRYDKLKKTIDEKFELLAILVIPLLFLSSVIIATDVTLPAVAHFFISGYPVGDWIDNGAIFTLNICVEAAMVGCNTIARKSKQVNDVSTANKYTAFGWTFFVLFGLVVFFQAFGVDQKWDAYLLVVRCVIAGLYSFLCHGEGNDAEQKYIADQIEARASKIYHTFREEISTLVSTQVSSLVSNFESQVSTQVSNLVSSFESQVSNLVSTQVSSFADHIGEEVSTLVSTQVSSSVSKNVHELESQVNTLVSTQISNFSEQVNMQRHFLDDFVRSFEQQIDLFKDDMYQQIHHVSTQTVEMSRTVHEVRKEAKLQAVLAPVVPVAGMIEAPQKKVTRMTEKKSSPHTQAFSSLQVEGVTNETVQRVLAEFKSGKKWREIPGHYTKTIKPIREAFELYMQTTDDKVNTDEVKSVHILP